MLGRILIAVFAYLPLAIVVNVIGYFITLISLTIVLGCIAPPEAIQALAALEFMLAMLYSLVHIVIIVFAEDPKSVQP